MKVERVPREMMHRAHEEYRARRAMPAPVRRANVREVLDLGSTLYVLFRGTPFGIPPVPWDVGQRVLELRMAAQEAVQGGVLRVSTSPVYFRSLGQLPRLLWRHMHPVGWWRRHFKWLLPNPFKKATEAELVELADFFSQRRMVSGVGVQPVSSPESMTP